MFVSLPWPRVSTNHLWQRTANGMRLSPAARAWKDAAIVEIRTSGQRLPSGLLSATFWFYRPNLQRCDVDNKIKAVQDAIFAAFEADDAAVNEIHAYRLLDRERPRVDVQIVAIEENSPR